MKSFFNSLKAWLIKALRINNVLKFIYSNCRKSKKEILTFHTIFSILTSICFAIYTYYYLKQESVTAIKSIALIILSVLGLICMFGIRKFIQNTGVKCNVIFPDKYIIKIKGVGFRIVEPELDGTYFELATERTARLAAQINAEIFKGTSWTATLDEKYVRNLSHIKRSANCFLFFKSKIDNEVIGFSHVLPVSRGTWDEYMRGEIDDNGFPAHHIVPDKSPIGNMQPFGLIIFSVAIKKKNKDMVDPATYKKDVGDLLEHATAYHVNLYIKQFFHDWEHVDVLLQNEDPKYDAIFKGYSVKNKLNISKDGEQIINFKVRIAY